MSTATRHRAATKARVLVLYTGGWRAAAIQRILAAEGHKVPTRNTIHLWTHPEAAAAHSQHVLLTDRRARVATATFSRPGRHGPEWKVARMRLLRSHGVSRSAVARVMSIDFREHFTCEQVDEAVSSGNLPGEPAVDARERALREGRLARVATATFAWPGGRATPEWKLGRMQRLRDAGVAVAAIAVVMSIDFPDEPLERHQVEYALRHNVAPVTTGRGRGRRSVAA